VRAFLDERAHPGRRGDRGGLRADEIAPLPVPWDDDDARARQGAPSGILGRRGLLAPSSRSTCAVLHHPGALAAISPLADAVFALQALGTVPIALAGSDERGSAGSAGARAARPWARSP
jgi:hypothetical protein